MSCSCVSNELACPLSRRLVRFYLNYTRTFFGVPLTLFYFILLFLLLLFFLLCCGRTLVEELNTATCINLPFNDYVNFLSELQDEKSAGWLAG